ncbi:MAG: MMPL family transporter [Deltaproteobacteria bacterium]|nr:MMPL family transporter [Deltaproteobacteria bacterium]
MSNQNEELNPFFAGLARWVIGHRAITIALAMLITTICMVRLVTHPLILDNRPEVFEPKGSNATVVLSELREEFGRDDLFLIIFEGDVFSLDFLKRLQAVHDEVAKVDMELEDPIEEAADENSGDDAFGEFGGDSEWGDDEGGTIIDQVISLTGVRETRASPDGIVVGELMDEWPTSETMAAFKGRVVGDSSFVNKIVDKEGKRAVMAVRTIELSEPDSARVYHLLHDILDKHKAEGFSPLMGGTPSFTIRLNEINIMDMATTFLLSMLVMVCVMAYLFRHWVGILGPLVVVQLSSIWTVALMSFLGMSLNYINSVVTVFLVSVAVGDAIHIQSLYRDKRRDGLSNEDAIIHTLGCTGVPIFYTSITTMIGLFSFALASIKPVNELGVMGGCGVFFAFLVSCTVVPVLLTFNKTSNLGARDNPESGPIDKLLDLCNRASGAGPNGKRNLRLSVVMGVVIVAAGIASAPSILVTHDPLMWFPDHFETKRASDTLDEYVGGASQMSLLIEIKSDLGIKDLEFMKALEKFEAYIHAYRDPHYGDIVGNITSVLDIVRETNRALHGGEQAFYKIPDTPRELADVLFLFENAGPDQLRRLATNDLRKTQVTMNLKWLHGDEYRPLTDYIEKGIEEYMAPTSRVRPTGLIYSVLSTMGVLVIDLAKSFGSAFFLITILLILLMKNLKIGLVGMIPNLVPIIMAMGLMAVLGIPLDGFTILVASIALGLCVDDTIHFLHHIRLEHQKTGDIEEAIHTSFKHSGRAIMATSAILILGLAPCMTADLKAIVWFGLVVCCTIFFAVVADLILAPAVIRILFRKKG